MHGLNEVVPTAIPIARGTLSSGRPHSALLIGHTHGTCPRQRARPVIGIDIGPRSALLRPCTLSIASFHSFAGLCTTVRALVGLGLRPPSQSHAARRTRHVKQGARVSPVHSYYTTPHCSLGPLASALDWRALSGRCQVSGSVALTKIFTVIM